MHSDEVIDATLEKFDIKELQIGDLRYKIDVLGSNLSLGEKQIIVLMRAILQ